MDSVTRRQKDLPPSIVRKEPGATRFLAMKLEIDFEKTKQKKEKAHNKTRCLYVYRCAGGGPATQVLKLAHDIDLTEPGRSRESTEAFPFFLLPPVA